MPFDELIAQKSKKLKKKREDIQEDAYRIIKEM